MDHRADMFAFGAVLYEMLSGERAFKGETAADTMTAILTKDPPDLDAARLSISPGLDRIVRRCLEKTPDLRFQSANDLAFALETCQPHPRPRHARRRRGSRQLVIGPHGVAAVGRRGNCLGRGCRFVAVERETREQSEASLGFISRGSASSAGEETSPTLSPDGRRWPTRRA